MEFLALTLFYLKFNILFQVFGGKLTGTTRAIYLTKINARSRFTRLSD